MIPGIWFVLALNEMLQTHAPIDEVCVDAVVAGRWICPMLLLGDIGSIEVSGDKNPCF